MVEKVESVLTLRESAHFAGVSPKRIEKSATEMRAGRVERVGRQSVTTVSPDLVIYEAALAGVGGARFSVSAKKRFLGEIGKLRKKTAGAEVHIDDALILRLRSEAVERYRRAMDYIARKKTHLESREDIFGGEFVVKGTRIPARFVADVVGSGGSLDDFCRDYPDIPRAAFETAVEYASCTPRMGRPATLRPKDASKISVWN